MLNCRMDYEQSFLRTLCSLMLMSTLPDCVMSDVNAFSDAKTGLENLLPSTMCLQNSSIASIYGIMFDAGSTGTRIHIYSFTQKYPDHLPELEREIFESVKPGLSTYADIPEQGAATIRELLEIAKNAVPSSQWKNTPVVLKATAGLRLLPEEKAKTLLSKVRDVFKDSPFLVPDKSVSIMNGTYEGILAWITVNFLTGQLYSQSKQTLGILDLGGASTQITFLPQSEETIEQSPLDFITSFKMFQSTYKLYTHSYLGLGLKAARLATLGAVETGATDKQIFRSSCFPEHLEAEWQFGGVSYRYGGIANGKTGFKPCYTEVLRVVKGKLHQAPEIRGNSFYAFSYYYDRAVDTNLIDYNKGGIVEVKDFERKAIEVCDHMESFTSNSPFLCMDLSYITALLKEGFGFEARTPLQLRKKVNNVETGWTLGATFLMLQSLRISH
ncbi:ectonucleoside triphosphate diphosphohydrolase 5 isoform X2 [Rhinatrema bivittatum]|nr:ectonucleoside triphosphate diphosphohydrolase 5 isoform X2 [Rhinatrema bivittatum]XP_029454306.1 ectonucleoside triphosphate diphosphohydrolase 5 isoform X2 [Rhinatrema bivittatum]XP_029454307.1 ectonucleoside triphosphate diphosphohydrolase 5 isoform X2 [Rhinatrema bivittatum]XP_029454308.1 ectonucleoside triphosphate diphosphohydrolase 5 isoform X2 [Rhinatrema bivittatum]